MPGDNTNTTQNIVRNLTEGSAARAPQTDQSVQETLSKISRNIEIIARNSSNTSQGSAKSKMNDEAQRGKRMSDQKVGRKEKKQEKVRGGLDGFFDGIEDALLGDFKKGLKDSVGNFTKSLSKDLGVTPEALPNKIGETLTNSAMESFKSTKIGEQLSTKFAAAGGEITNLVNAGLNSASSAISTAASGGGLQAAMTSFSSTFAASGASISAAAGSAGSALLALGPYALAAGVAIVAVGHIFKQLSKAGQALKEGFAELKEGVSQAANRDVSSQREMVELGKQRLQKDVDLLVTEPFNNLKDATNDLCSAWEQSIASINATQGYSKESLQDLISNYASRLRSEGLSSVVSSADITTNLEKVLQAGLSGIAAEEFAYMATVLGEAVPTQDFFSYASTYASIAANAIKDGMSQTDALTLANYEMEQFASNVLYASRQLAGGFSTGLQNTADLFSDAHKIAQSAKQGDAAQISGVLTSVAGIIGAIAPDLSDSIVDAVVDSAIGGNKETNVALRSLAGVNASNTQFLKALATQPQQIFTTLFNNLATMQSSSADNFMEVAEGLAGVFGVPMESLARVYFSYLADAISQMNLNNNSLDENLAMLSDGQTKTTTEQLKIAEINKLMIEEGLSYVLDSEAGRAIQEHLWEEQLAMELKESTYAVELQGSAAKFLEKISEAVKSITSILNPFSWFKKIENIVLTAAEGEANDADIKQLLELGNVGKANTKVLNQLLTRGKQQNLTDSLITQLGGTSARDAVQSVIARNNAATKWGYNPITMLYNSVAHDVSNLASEAYDMLQQARNTASKSNIASTYQWGTVSKSLNSIVQQSSKNAAYYTEQIQTSVAAKVDQKAQSNFENFMSTMDQFVKDGKSYADWAATASRFGIKDIKKSAEDFGVTEEALQGKFQEHEASQAAEHEYNRQLKEDEFWKESINYVKNTAPSFHNELITLISKFYKKYQDFYNDWIDYYVKHTAYSAGTLDAYKVEQILNADKHATGDAVNALADALLSNAVDLKDPQIQTNVLLSQMLVTLNAILQQETKTNNSVLPTSLSALGLGLVSNT